MAEYQFFSKILELSEAEDWDDAVTEWQLKETYLTMYPDTCICGHFPINEICIVRNKLTGNVATVGNSCVKKFLNLPSDEIFTPINRIQKNIYASVNKAMLNRAFSKGWISDWDYGFYNSIMKKKKLTDSQLEYKVGINRKILRHFIRNGNKNFKKQLVVTNL